MRIRSRFVGFLLGALLGEVATVCIYAVFVMICFVIREPRGLDDLDPFFFGGVAAVVVGPLVGGILGVRIARRSDIKRAET